MNSLKRERGRPRTLPTEPIKKEDLMSITELSEFLSMSKSHIYTLTSNKKIPHIKLLGKKLLFSRTDITKWIKSKSVSPK
jgi:excisionase family DNA binding protein